ncbi:MAG: hypothetical protein RSE13_04685 [Planktothrix sp. GU0601_MAG3]|nr:MAG: hypothetical protein RSE13_04685 [Planktothrix sp. GU0601_MAG3]
MKVKPWIKIFFWAVIVMGIIIGYYSGFSDDKIEPIAVYSQPQITLSPSLIDPQIDTIDPAQLGSHLKVLVGERFQDSDRERVRNYLIKQLELFNFSPSLQSFDQGVNIVAEHLGTDPKAGVILLAAHYDTVSQFSGG